ncbi:MAG: DNA polymerase IV [Mycoplasmataceae bacterium]|nr:DNA polymerase IV [Mycoplasmataceae bacterium]
MKYLLHIDMDCFFAAVEERLNKRYVNKPMVVSLLASKSIICCANYQARSFGIRAAMPLFKALKLCPSIYVCPPHFNQYERFNRLFVSLIKKHFTNIVEVCSIDECYVDISSLAKSKEQAIKVGRNIQARIKKELGLSCSVGVSYNRFLSKMASDYKKPGGITAIWQEDIPKMIWPQPVGNMLFIGDKTSKMLIANGIKTIGDFANEHNQSILTQLLDKNWYAHYLHANGEGADDVFCDETAPKSIGAEHTFNDNVDDSEEVERMIGSLLEEVYARMIKHKFFTKCINVKIKTDKGVAKTKSKTIPPTDNLEIISNIVYDLYQKNYSNTIIRLVGVSLSSLVDKQSQVDLFHQTKEEKKDVNEIEEIIKSINKRLEKNSINTANKVLKN